MNRDWQKDMEMMKGTFEFNWTKNQDLQIEMGEALPYWLQQFADLKARNDEMLKVLERVKADIDEFRSYIDVDSCETVEDQAKAFNELLKAEKERADKAEAREHNLMEEIARAMRYIDKGSYRTAYHLLESLTEE